MPKLAPTAAALTALALCASGATLAQAAPKAQVKVTATPIVKALVAKNTTTTITVRNTTARRLSGLSLVVGAKKGVRVTLPGAKRGTRLRALKPLAAGKSVRVKVRLARVGKTGPRSGALAVSVRRSGKVIGTTRLAFGPNARPVDPEPTTLANRHYWGSRYTLNGIQQYTVYFTGPSFVFTGEPEGAWPTCTAASETCKPYTYDAKTKALTIDGVAATLEGNKLTLDGQAHWELGRPAAGARWDIVLTHSNSSGICPLYCSYFTEHLTFRPDGTFVRSSVASGTGPVADWAVVPDDSKGTYEVGTDRVLRLSFADGKQRAHTLGLFPEDGGTYPANPTGGIVLDNDGYFDIRD